MVNINFSSLSERDEKKNCVYNTCTKCDVCRLLNKSKLLFTIHIKLLLLYLVVTNLPHSEIVLRF